MSGQPPPPPPGGMPPGPPPGQSYGGRGAEVLAIAWVFFGVGIVVVALRTYTTLFIVKRPRWDLYLTLIGTVCAIVAQPFIHMAPLYGVGQTFPKVSMADLPIAQRNLWAFAFSANIAMIFSKMATASLILQIQGKVWPKLRWLLIGVVAINAILGFIGSGLIFAQCSPTSDLWNTNPNFNPNCKLFAPGLRIGTTQGSFSAFCDVFLAVYPAIIFWNLNMSWQRRLGVWILFSGGFVAGTLAILKTVRILKLGETADLTNAIADLMIWAQIEMWLILTLTCMPPMRPLLVRVSDRFSKGNSSIAYLLRRSIGRSSSNQSGGKRSGGHYRGPSGDSAEQKPGAAPRHSTMNFTRFNFGFSKLGSIGGQSTLASKYEKDGEKSVGTITQDIAATDAWYDGANSDEEALYSRTHGRTYGNAVPYSTVPDVDVHPVPPPRAASRVAPANGQSHVAGQQAANLSRVPTNTVQPNGIHVQRDFRVSAKDRPA